MKCCVNRDHVQFHPTGNVLPLHVHILDLQIMRFGLPAVSDSALRLRPPLSQGDANLAPAELKLTCSARHCMALRAADYVPSESLWAFDLARRKKHPLILGHQSAWLRITIQDRDVGPKLLNFVKRKTRKLLKRPISTGFLPIRRFRRRQFNFCPQEVATLFTFYKTITESKIKYCYY